MSMPSTGEGPQGAQDRGCICTGKCWEDYRRQVPATGEGQGPLDPSPLRLPFLPLLSQVSPSRRPPGPGFSGVTLAVCVVTVATTVESCPKATRVSPEPRSPLKVIEPLCNHCQKPPLIITNKLPDSQLGKDAHSSKHPIVP